MRSSKRRRRHRLGIASAYLTSAAARFVTSVDSDKAGTFPLPHSPPRFHQCCHSQPAGEAKWFGSGRRAGQQISSVKNGRAAPRCGLSATRQVTVQGTEKASGFALRGWALGTLVAANFTPPPLRAAPIPAISRPPAPSKRKQFLRRRACD
jgi:hypothetical protein